MRKIVKYFGLDVHKNSISIAIAEDGKKGELTFTLHRAEELTAIYVPSTESVTSSFI